MTKHVRAQIRDAIVTMLSTVLSDANIIRSPYRPLAESDLPCFIVYSQSPTTEASEIASMAGPTNRRLARTYNLNIDIVVQDGGESLEDIVDQHAAEIEAKLDEGIFLPNSDLLRLTKNMNLISSRLEFGRLANTESGEVPIGRLTMTYRITYHTLTGTPTVAA